jgi:hypothetical protein
MYMFNWQINGWILKECFGESQEGGLGDSSSAEVDDIDGAPRYVGNYLNMQSYRVRKYIMSAGWVFKVWIAWSKWFKKNYGVYPDQKYPGVLVKLARMPKRVRDEIILPKLMKKEG